MRSCKAGSRTRSSGVVDLESDRRIGGIAGEAGSEASSEGEGGGGGCGAEETQPLDSDTA